MRRFAGANPPLRITVDKGYYIGRMQYAPTDDVGNYAAERAKRPGRGVLHTPYQIKPNPSITQTRWGPIKPTLQHRQMLTTFGMDNITTTLQYKITAL